MRGWRVSWGGVGGWGEEVWKKSRIGEIEEGNLFQMGGTGMSGDNEEEKRSKEPTEQKDGLTEVG